MSSSNDYGDTVAANVIDIDSARTAVSAVQRRWSDHSIATKAEAKDFGVRKRTALYAELAIAFRVASQLLEKGNEALFDAILAENGMERDKRRGINPYSTVVRLLFNGDRSAYKYAASFRHMRDQNIDWEGVVTYLEHYGLAKTERSDRAKYSAGDPDEVIKQARLREFISVMPGYGWVSTKALASNVPHEGGQLVALWGIVRAGQIEVRGSLPVPTKKVVAHVLKEANERVADVEAEKAEQQRLYEQKVELWREQHEQMDSAAEALNDAGFHKDAARCEANKLNGEERYEQRKIDRELLADKAVKQAIDARTIEFPMPRKERTEI